MSNLQTIVFGAASDGSQGDNTRVAFTKDNSNVAILNAQATLTSFATTITTASALTAASHLGKRVNVNLASPGTINLPTAVSCGADGVILLRNLGATLVTLAITAGSGDTVALVTLAAGETALMDTDGVHAWNCVMRGRSNSANETVQGNCAVLGNETVGGTLVVTGAVTGNSSVAAATVAATTSVTSRDYYAQGPSGASGTSRNYYLTMGTQAAVRWAISSETTPETGGNVGSNLLLSRYSDAGGYLGSPIGISRSTGAITLSGVSTVTATGSGNVATPTLLLQGGAGYSYLGLYGFNNGAAVQVRVSSNTGISCAEFINYNASGFASINASAFTVSSDAAFKSDVAGLGPVMPKLRNKRGFSYLLKASPGAGRKIGIIAQDWQEDFPELVNETAEIDEDGDFIARQYDAEGKEIFGVNGPPECRRALGFEYGNGFAVLLEGLRETDAALTAALARIGALEGCLAATGR